MSVAWERLPLPPRFLGLSCGFGLELGKGGGGGILPEDSKLFFFLLRMTDFLTLRFPAACQRLGCCLAKSYPGRAIERALSKYTWGGSLSSPPTCPAPVLGAVPHISPDHSPFRLREKNKA